MEPASAETAVGRDGGNAGTAPQLLPSKFHLGRVASPATHTLSFVAGDPLPGLAEHEFGRTPGVAGTAAAPLYVPLPRRWEMGDLVDELVPLLDGESGDCDVVVLRAHPPDVDALRRAAGSGYIAERAQERPVWLLSLQDGQPRLSDLASGGRVLAGADEELYLRFLRECELRTYADLPGVHLPASDEFHYEAPNGKHYQSFLRVGSMLQSIEAVDSLCFWLTPRLAGASMVLLDSPSILSLGLNASQYVTQALGRADALGVETLSAYDEQEVTLAPRLRALRPPGEDRPTLAFVVSMVSTGRLAHTIQGVCEREDLDLNVVPVFGSVEAVEKEARDPLCVVAGITQAYDAPCELCRQGSRKLKILPGTYTLEVAAEVKETSITKKDAASGKRFLEHYGGSDGLSVHRSDPGDGRHHAIYVDTGRLLETSGAFKEAVAACIGGAGEIGAVLSPEHDAARAMAQLAHDVLGAPVARRDESRLPVDPEGVQACFDDEWLEGLRSKPRLLLVDDVVITGGRLRRYLNAIEPLLEALSKPELVYLVGVARPASVRELETIPQMLRGRGEFRAVEELVLPNWGTRDCPWCLELDDIGRVGVPESGLLRARYDRLSDLDAGLRGDVLLPWRGEDVNELRGSIFGEGTASDLFVSIASAIQRLRSERRLDETFRPPLAKVLDPKNTAETRFFEYRILALILRACRAHDVNTRLVEPQLTALLRGRLAGDREPGTETVTGASEARSELILAGARDKVPRAWLVRRGDDEKDRDVIEQVLDGAEDSIGTFLRALIAPD